MTWISLQDVVDVLEIEPKRAPVFLYVEAQSGARTRATTKGGVQLDIPEVLPATLWASQPENPIRWVSHAYARGVVMGVSTELQAELGDYGGIQFCYEDLRERLTGTTLPADDPDPPTKKRGGGGRHESPLWLLIWVELHWLIDEHEDVGEATDVAKRVRDRLEERGIEVPLSVPWMAERIGQYLELYQNKPTRPAKRRRR